MLLIANNLLVWLQFINSISTSTNMPNYLLLVLSIEPSILTVLRFWWSIILVYAAASTFYYIRYIIRTRSGLSPPPLPEPEREKKEKADREKKKIQEEKEARKIFNMHIALLGAAIFGIVLYLGYHFAIEFSLEDEEGDDFVTNYGDEYLDYYYGDRHEVTYEYNKDDQKYELVVEDIWTEDELDDDEVSV